MSDESDISDRGPDPADRPPASAGPRAGAIDVIAEIAQPEHSAEERQALAALREAALRAAGVLPQPTLPRGEQPRFWFRPSDQRVVACLAVLMTVLMSAHWVRISDWGRKPVEVDRLPAAEYEYLIDINRATWVEWAQFEGIGEALAKRIVADRDERGPFRSVDDVLRVRGIGPARMSAMRASLRVDLDAQDATPP